MASLGHVSLDGSEFKANTFKHKAMSYGCLKAKEKELTEEIEALLAKTDNEIKRKNNIRLKPDIEYLKNSRL